MLEFTLDAHRGGFHLQMECRLPSHWTVIFGPSGSGKSTLLRFLAGLDWPEAGRIMLDGQSLTDTAKDIYLYPGRRHTSLVAQQPALFPHMSVATNVAYGLGRIDRSARSTRVEQMLELVGASYLTSRHPRELSGGEAQRVALARSLAPLPRLLLLDEPFSALDGSASDALLGRLRGWVNENNVQTVLATHDATDAYSTNAEVVLMHEGRLTATGPAGQVLARERERIVKRFEGADPISN